MKSTALIGVDWGTTNCRAMKIAADGRVIDERTTPNGILNVASGDFAAALQGQVGDWMNEIYPRWVAAHGILIVTPVHWNQAPSVLKLMIDRLVCADGGNPDPTSTHGKDPAKAKELELKGWHYPRHLAGRAFAVVVHADAEGSAQVRHNLADWLTSMHLIEAGASATLDRYVGYYEPYATSHESLDRDESLQKEVRTVAQVLVKAVALSRSGRLPRADDGIRDPRPK